MPVGRLRHRRRRRHWGCRHLLLRPHRVWALPARVQQAPRTRYALPQASSAVKGPGDKGGGSSGAEWRRDDGVDASVVGRRGGSPTAADWLGALEQQQQLDPPLTLQQELQTVLGGLSHQEEPEAVAAGPPLPPHAAPVAGGGGSGRHPALCGVPLRPTQHASQEERQGHQQRQQQHQRREGESHNGGARSGRRWRAHQPQPTPPARGRGAGDAARNDGSGDGDGDGVDGAAFFSVDADLLRAHAQRQAAAVAVQQQGGRQQRRGGAGSTRGD